MNIAGTWQLEIRTPIGRQQPTVTFTQGPDGWDGVAHSGDGDIALTDITLDGEQLSWSQSVTRPMRLNLRFDVIVTGDTLAGTSKAGRLPKSTVTGTRLPAAPGPQPA